MRPMRLQFLTVRLSTRSTDLTRKAGIPDFGHTYLYDGGTGQRFDQPATVGVIYMLSWVTW